MKLSIDLPQFPGFYESEIDDIFEISDDLESYGDVTQEQYDNIDWLATHTAIAKEYASLFFDQNKDFLQLAGIKSMTFEKLDSPKYYNYSTDKLVVNVDFNVAAFKKMVRATVAEFPKQFETFVNDKYSSRSGFCSFYSNDVNLWLGEYINKKLSTDNVIFEGFLEFLMENVMPDYDKDGFITEGILYRGFDFLTFLPEYDEAI